MHAGMAGASHSLDLKAAILPRLCAKWAKAKEGRSVDDLPAEMQARLSEIMERKQADYDKAVKYVNFTITVLLSDAGSEA